MPSSASGWTARFMMLFGAVFGGLPLLVYVLLSFSTAMPHDDWILDYRGAVTSAKPTAIRSGNSRVNWEDVSNIDVEYADTQGRQHSASVATLSASLITKAKAKTPFKIQYDPELPARARVLGGSACPGGMAAWLPLLFGCIGIPVLVAGVLSAVRRRNLYRHGTPVRALVVTVEESGNSDGGRRVMVAHYSYQHPQGTSEGKLQSLVPPEVGASIWVLFDPKHPDRSIEA